MTHVVVRREVPAALAARKHPRPARYAWFMLVFVWSIARALVVRATLSKYGVNFGVYLVIDLLTTVPYAIASAKAVAALRAHNRHLLVRAGTVTAITFIIPDLYLLLHHGIPAPVRWTIMSIVAVLATYTVHDLRSKSRKHDATRHTSMAETVAG